MHIRKVTLAIIICAAFIGSVATCATASARPVMETGDTHSVGVASPQPIVSPTIGLTPPVQADWMCYWGPFDVLKNIQ